MTFPDPDDQERDGPARQASSQDQSGFEDTDTTFARIVAGLQAAEPDVPRSTVSEADQDRFLAPQLPTSQPHHPADEADEDHFEPPEPPPLPVPRPRTVGGVVVLTVGVLLLAAPALLGLADRVATPLGLLTLTAGIGWLVIGLRSDPPPGSDDGAQL